MGSETPRTDALQIEMYRSLIHDSEPASGYHLFRDLARQLERELVALTKEADKFEDGIDWMQRVMQAEALLAEANRKLDEVEKKFADWQTEAKAAEENFGLVP